MAGIAFYSSKISGQYKSAYYHPVAGISGYFAPDSIGDDLFSDAWETYYDEIFRATSLYKIPENELLNTNAYGAGYVFKAISAIYDNDHHVILITRDDAVGADDYADDFVDYIVDDNTKSSIDISSYNLSGYADMCLFNTEANKYVCAIFQNNKKLLYYDFTEVKTADLPFYPKKIAPHTNRIFAIDTGNKLWWCRLGDIASWYGMDEDDDYVVTSTTMANGAYTIAAQPDVPRPLSFTVTKNGTIDTLGTIAVVGTNYDDEGQSETVTPIEGKVLSQKSYKTVTSLTQSGHSASGGADSIKIGIAAVGNGHVQEDAGMWTMENESDLYHIVELESNLYIFSEKSIYIFQGYDYSTFSLVRIVADVGCSAGTEIATYNNVAYFWGNDGCLYEYFGAKEMRVINRPVYQNGQITNGILGSKESWPSSTKLVVANGILYVYSTTLDVGGVAGSYFVQLRYYQFDIKTRTWWKRAGFSHTYNPLAYFYTYPFYIAMEDKAALLNIFNVRVGDADANWYIYEYPGNCYDSDPYIITKAFNTGSSEDQTLSDIILTIRSVDGPLSAEDGTLSVYVSTTIDDDDFTLVKELDGSYATYEPNTITIPLAASVVCRVQYYRIKIVWSSDDYSLQLLGIERRYRLIGRSR